MKITMNQNGSALSVALEGRLDTATAPELEEALNPVLTQCDAITYDFKDLEYISSAGLRVLMKAHLGMRMGGVSTVVNANDIVKEVIRITGLNDILTVK